MMKMMMTCVEENQVINPHTHRRTQKKHTDRQTNLPINQSSSAPILSWRSGSDFAAWIPTTIWRPYCL